MKLSMATNHFKRTALDGWDGTSWTLDAAYGDFHTYDRFISDRSFGQKKRIFTTGNVPIPVDIQVLRMKNGTRYMIGSFNADTEEQIYNYIYQLEEAPFDCDVIEIQSERLASGVAGTATEIVRASTFCDVERVSSHQSKVFTDLKYVTYEITMPLAMQSYVSADSILSIGLSKYNVKEVSYQINLLSAMAVKKDA